MELILISDTKLKVMLTPLDMQKYELDNSNIDYDNTETRRAFWQILDEAKHKTGFDAASDKVFIQVYPSRSGGCEMYVTKLGNAKHKENKTETQGRKNTYSLLRGKTNVYRFEKLEHVSAVCRQLSAMDYAYESGLYLSEDGKYDLVIYENTENNEGMTEYSFIEEYANKRQGEIELAYTKEHGVCIESAHAVEKMSVI